MGKWGYRNNTQNIFQWHIKKDKPWLKKKKKQEHNFTYDKWLRDIQVLWQISRFILKRSAFSRGREWASQVWRLVSSYEGGWTVSWNGRNTTPPGVDECDLQHRATRLPGGVWRVCAQLVRLPAFTWCFLRMKLSTSTHKILVFQLFPHIIFHTSSKNTVRFWEQALELTTFSSNLSTQTSSQSSSFSLPLILHTSWRLIWLSLNPPF